MTAPRHLRILLLALLLALVAACDQADMLQKFAPSAGQALARDYIDRLRAHDFEPIEKAADPRITGPGLREALEKMAGFFPPGEPRSVKLVGAHKNYGAGVSSLNTTFEYEFVDRWLIVNVVVQQKDGAKTITGFNVYPRNQSLEAENRFTLVGKQPLHYLALAAAIAAALTSLYALVACARTPALRRKGLWIVFILLGIGEFAVNWTTGEWRFAPLSARLFSAGAVAPLYGPWIVSVSVPVGAVAFLVRAWRKARSQGANPPGESSAKAPVKPEPPCQP